LFNLAKRQQADGALPHVEGQPKVDYLLLLKLDRVSRGNRLRTNVGL
jgi:hypothetical protein